MHRYEPIKPFFTNSLQYEAPNFLVSLSHSLLSYQTNHKKDNLDDHGNPIEDPKRWQDYCERCFSQLEWWAEAAKEHKMVSDPFARSKPFQSSPSQRNAP